MISTRFQKSFIANWSKGLAEHMCPNWQCWRPAQRTDVSQPSVTHYTHAVRLVDGLDTSGRPRNTFAHDQLAMQQGDQNVFPSNSLWKLEEKTFPGDVNRRAQTAPFGFWLIPA